MKQNATENKLSFNILIKNLINFSNELTKTSGNLFLSNNQLSNVDITLLPWAYRYYVFEYYRGKDYIIPTDIEELQPYHNWYNYMISLPCVQRTLPNKDKYLEHIQKYANGTARSKVANAVRRGVEAHNFDDELDDYIEDKK